MDVLAITTQDTVNIIWLYLSLFIASIPEPFLWKTRLFTLFNVPIQAQWFGGNKRWRGLISLPLLTAASVCLLQPIEAYLFPRSTPLILFSNFNGLEYGLLVGFVFNLAELPNSFVKRRLQIPPGDESHLVFFWADHMDSTYGVLILWWAYFKFPLHLIGTGLVVAPLLFIVGTWIRKQLGLKS